MISRLRRPPAPLRGDAAILLYHRVADLRSDLWKLAVAPERFSEHLELMRGAFNVITLRELVESLRTGTLAPRSLVITFDDGYRDNLHTAKPLLERHGLPATVFVVAGYVDSKREFWWDELEQLLQAEHGDRPPDHRALRDRLQRLSHDERQRALDELWKASDATRPAPSSVSTSAEIRALAEGGLVEIGAHTVTHPLLSRERRASRAAEIRTSKSRLSELLGHPVDYFSYPHGDYDRKTVQAVAESGFLAACSSRAGAVHAESQPFELPRLAVGDWGPDELGERLSALLV
jgi:peptidoglycan/xylan/chitin deacetylase (PgdA/CDA1 family)